MNTILFCNGGMRMRYSDYIKSHRATPAHEIHQEEFYDMCKRMIEKMFPTLFKEHFYRMLKETELDKKIEMEAAINTYLNGEAIHARKELTYQIAMMIQEAISDQSIKVVL